MLVYRYPYSTNAVHDGLMRYDVGNTVRLTWWTVHVPEAGRLVPPAWLHVRARPCWRTPARAPSWPHHLSAAGLIIAGLAPPMQAHRARLTGLVLLSGMLEPAQFGTLAPDCLRHGRVECASHDALQNYLVQQAAESVICFTNVSVPSFVVQPPAEGVESGMSNGGSMSYYDRQGQLLCQPHAFARDDAVTVVAFTKSVWKVRLTPRSTWRLPSEVVHPSRRARQAEETHFPMHTMFFVHFEPATNVRRGAPTAPRGQGALVHPDARTDS